MTGIERPPALELRGLKKSFGQTEVIRSVNLLVQPGERVGIIGPNGAGKSTLFNLISGRDAPDGGQILLNGQRIDDKPPYQIQRLGLSRSFQMSQVFPNLSVFDNLRCGVLWRMGYQYTFWKWLVGLEDVNLQTEQVLALVRLDRKRHTLATHLTHAEQRALDIGITLASGAPVVLLDEPTAGMSRSEARDFTGLIKAATLGKTLLIIEHDMSVLYGLAQKIAVLIDGQLLAFDSADVVRANPLVQAAYLGDVALARG